MNREMYRLRQSDVERLNFRLMVVTVSMALLYLAVCVWQALGSSHTENLDATLSVNPRSVIVLCWVAAAIGVAFMPEIGKVFAAMALLAVIAFFGYWGYITAGIKTNLGVTAFNQASFGGNWFIGATFFDLVTLVVAVGLVVYDVRVIYKNLQLRATRERTSNVASPPVMAK